MTTQFRRIRSPLYQLFLLLSSQVIMLNFWRGVYFNFEEFLYFYSVLRQTFVFFFALSIRCYTFLLKSVIIIPIIYTLFQYFDAFYKHPFV